MTAADLAAMLMAAGRRRRHHARRRWLDDGARPTARRRRGDPRQPPVGRLPTRRRQRLAGGLVRADRSAGEPSSCRPSSRTMVVGQAASFSAHGVDAAMNGIPIAASAVAWSMTGSGATLSSSGRFQAHEPGSATVTAAAAGAGRRQRHEHRGRHLRACRRGSRPSAAARWHGRGGIGCRSPSAGPRPTDLGTGVAGYGSAAGSAVSRGPTSRCPRRPPAASASACRPARAVQYQVRATDRSRQRRRLADRRLD